MQKHLAAAAALAAALGATTALTAPSSASAATLVALTAEGRLLTLDAASRRVTGSATVRGAAGRVVAIDVRPADGRLYGVTDQGTIIRLDPATGMAEQVSKLDKPLETGPRVSANFNPTVDRLRVVGLSGTNYRINVDTGAVTVDGPLRYQPDSPMAGRTPMVAGAAYTNSFAGSKETALYTLDVSLSQLNLQAPPNDGVQQPKGMVGVSLPPGIGFDILSDGNGGNTAYLLAGETLHTVDLATGRATAAGPVAGFTGADLVSLAAMR